MENEKKQLMPSKKIVNSKFKKLFSTEELDELKSAYAVFEDENGLINIEKVCQIFSSLGYETNNKNLMEMLNYLKSINKNNMINFNDFLESCEKFLGVNTPDKELKEIYSLFTEKGSQDSVITLDSFKKMLSSLGEEMCNEDIELLFSINSKNKDFLNFDDFIKIFRRRIDLVN